MLQAIMTVVTMKKTEFEKCRWWRKGRKWWEHAYLHLVCQLRVKYGPSSSPPKKADALWSTLGQQISKQECLYRDFEVEFGGDMERYSPSSHIKVGSGGRLS